MRFKSINPFSNQLVNTYEEFSDAAILNAIENTSKAKPIWKKTTLNHRIEIINEVANILRANEEGFAKMITLEMGKPIRESRSEIKKCEWLCRYYTENAVEFLSSELIETDASKSFIQNDPLGCILGIMPWNFPFWQTFRFAIPALLTGNTVLLKHAPNVFGCATQIEELFLNADLPKGVFQNLIIHHNRV